MKLWILAAGISAILGSSVAAQESVPTEAGSAVAAPLAITSDSLTPDSIRAFVAALKQIREIIPVSTSDAAGATKATEAENQASGPGQTDCAPDEEPFADLFSNVPIKALDEIAKANGFKDARHWQRVGLKVIAKSAIEAMAKQSKLDESEMDLVVGDALEAE